MDGKEPITEPKDVANALEIIKSIEFMGFAIEETMYKPKFFNAINKCMWILREIHDDLVVRLPKEVIDEERMKGQPKTSPILKPNTIPMGAA